MSVVEAFPYTGAPAHQNWRSAVSAIADRCTIDPQGPVKFQLATAGSCFAQRLAERLPEIGLCYVVTEPGGEPFSARYGNIYTSRQLLQLLERALGRFEPLERAWAVRNGYIDPFRPGVAAATFSSIEALETDRRIHLAAVRDLFAGIDVFLFTLGLTELWIDARDGAAFPACPGRGRGEFDPGRHVFRNLDVASVTQDLEAFIALFREINPAGKIILTVSPVPMAATMVPMHVVRASLTSKSVLKVAAEAIAANHPHVDYFAAYDAIVQNLGGERLFESGGRQPTDAIADRVIQFFVNGYFGAAVTNPATVRAQPAHPGLQPSAAGPCDDEILLDLIAREDERRTTQDSARGVRQAAHPIPLYFIGDSNSLIFKDRVFAVAGSSSAYIGRTLHTPGLRGSDLCDAGGRLNETLLSALVGEQLLLTDSGGGWRAFGRVGADPMNFVQDIEGRVRPNPPIVLFCGIFDWVQFFDEIGARDVGAPRTPEYAAAMTVASRYIEPLERGLRLLRSYGLRNLCLHSLHPPTPDDETFARSFFPSTSAARHASIRLMNELLRGACTRTETAFIDIWPLIAGENGMIDARYYFDAVHLNLDAALLTVKVLVETVESRPVEFDASVAPAAGSAAPSEELVGTIDDIANPLESRLGSGWYPLERGGDEIFRWAGDDAVLYVPVFSAADHGLFIELEPGPGVGGEPLSLEIFDQTGLLIAASIVRGRQTLVATLPASLPVMRSLRLHVVGGGRPIAGDERVLNYRVFRVSVTPRRVDVMPSTGGFHAGAGWYPLEEYGGLTFRWVNNDASIEVSSRASELALEVEPGPGVGSAPFTLTAFDENGAMLGSFVVSTREWVVIPLPLEEPTPYVIRLRVEGGGRTTLGDSRTLNFRVFQGT